MVTTIDDPGRRGDNSSSQNELDLAVSITFVDRRSSSSTHVVNLSGNHDLEM